MADFAFRTGAVEWRREHDGTYSAGIGPFDLFVEPAAGGGFAAVVGLEHVAILNARPIEAPSPEEAASKCLAWLRARVGEWATLVCGAP